MNRRLQDPFHQAFELPEVIEDYFDEHLAQHGGARCMAFNRQGSLFAAGTEWGRIVIWDFETRGIAKVLGSDQIPCNPKDEPMGDDKQHLQAAAPPVTAVAWSRNGRRLLAGSADGMIRLWDVLNGRQVFEMQAGGGRPISSVGLSPHEPHLAFACPVAGAPLLIEVAAGTAYPLPAFELSGGAAGRPLEVTVAPPQAAQQGGGAAAFSHDGKLLFAAHGKGLIVVLDTATRKVVDLVRLPPTARVVSLVLNRKGTLLLANCRDKIVRLLEVRPLKEGASSYAVEELGAALAATEPGKSGSLLQGADAAPLSAPGGGGGRASQFHNAVERTLWRGAAFSSDDEHVAAGAERKDGGHKVYIWNRTGKLERILEGSKDVPMVADLAWHPTSSMFVALAEGGVMYIWARVYEENWSAFAPDFKELLENVEYEEEEDEFDVNPRPREAGHGAGAGEAAAGGGAGASKPAVDVLSAARAADDEGGSVDVVTRDRLPVFSSDDEDEVSAVMDPASAVRALAGDGRGPGGRDVPVLFLPAEVKAEPERPQQPTDQDPDHAYQDAKLDGQAEEHGGGDAERQGKAEEKQAEDAGADVEEGDGGFKAGRRRAASAPVNYVEGGGNGDGGGNSGSDADTDDDDDSPGGKKRRVRFKQDGGSGKRGGRGGRRGGGGGGGGGGAGGSGAGGSSAGGDGNSGDGGGGGGGRTSGRGRGRGRKPAQPSPQGSSGGKTNSLTPAAAAAAAAAAVKGTAAAESPVAAAAGPAVARGAMTLTANIPVISAQQEQQQKQQSTSQQAAAQQQLERQPQQPRAARQPSPLQRASLVQQPTPQHRPPPHPGTAAAVPTACPHLPTPAGCPGSAAAFGAGGLSGTADSPDLLSLLGAVGGPSPFDGLLAASPGGWAGANGLGGMASLGGTPASLLGRRGPSQCAHGSGGGGEAGSGLAPGFA